MGSCTHQNETPPRGEAEHIILTPHLTSKPHNHNPKIIIAPPPYLAWRREWSVVTSLCSMSSSLCKQKSWSPDSTREEAWIRRGSRFTGRRGSSGGSLSFTDDDLDELRACIELGFGFDSPEIEINDRLTSTLPALGFYRAIVGQNYDGLLGRRKVDSEKSSSCSTPSEGNSPSPADSPAAIFRLGKDPKEVKTRLRQWAQVVSLFGAVQQLSVNHLTQTNHG